MKKSDLEIKIGMEVESNSISRYSAPSDFKEALRAIDRDLDWFNEDQDGTRSTFACLPEKFRPPEGWEKNQDGSCGLECKFSSPTTSLTEAENRAERLTEWFRNVGICSFKNAGTHIHLGTFDWIEKHFGSLAEQLGARARALLFGYFVTRERGIFQLVPARRKNNSYCDRGIPTDISSLNVNGIVVDRKTPAWAIHNLLLSQSPVNSSYGATYGFNSGAICNRRHLPTFEFRMFPGCGNPVALKGYLRLIHAMFTNVAPLILEEDALRSATEAKKVFITNPFTFTAQDLKSEFSDQWLKTWIDETLENDGNPINTDITSGSGPQRLATV